MSNTNLSPTPELLGAIACSKDEGAVQEIVARVFNRDVITINNSADEVNLALPFYSAMDSQLSSVSDSDIEPATGGIRAILHPDAHLIFGDTSRRSHFTSEDQFFFGI